ncbi:MAG TPA: NAD(P)H-dependent oxidoreductase [Acidimicrobiales bacterium]|nr:NAD(P)H-dependent oxidoreductase [Acidimicrobiales bacterium]
MLLQVITGTTREGRFSERVSAWVMARLAQHDAFALELVDLRDHPLPFFDGDAPARTGREYADESVTRFSGVIDRADGYLILTAEYNHGYPAVLKNALDSTFVEWRRKPVAYVGWGNTGGARAIEQLRAVAVEFEMAPLRHAVHVLPDVLIAARQAPDPADVSFFAPLEPRLDLLADDLAWWMQALASARAASG